MTAREQYQKFLKAIKEIPAEERATMTEEEINKRQIIMKFCSEMHNADVNFLLVFENDPIYTLSQYQRLLWNEKDGETSEKGEIFANHFFQQVCFAFYSWLSLNLRGYTNENHTFEDVIDYFTSNVAKAADYLSETIG